MFKYFLSTGILSISLATPSFATDSNIEDQSRSPFAANGVSRILAETDTKETAAAAFRGLDVTSALKRLVETPTCYIKYCFIKAPQLRTAYNAFCMDPTITSAYLKGELPVEIPSLLAQIGKPDFIEATTLVRSSKDSRGNGYSNIISFVKNHKSVCATLTTDSQQQMSYHSQWVVNEERYDDYYVHEGSKCISLTLFYDNLNKTRFYLKTKPTFEESSDHLACLLRTSVQCYFTSNGPVWINDAQRSMRMGVFIYLWSLVTQKKTFTVQDLSFLAPEMELDLQPNRINLEKLSYWFHQNVMLAPRDVNKRTPFAINPEFFLNHSQIKFTPYSLKDVALGAQKTITKGDKIDPTQALWLSCAALQLKDSYLAYDEFITTKKPQAHVVAYFKLLAEMFSVIERDYPTHVEVTQEAKLLNANISGVVPYLEDYKSVQTLNKSFLARMSPYVQSFIKHYLTEANLEEQGEMTVEEKEIAAGLI